MNQEPIHEVELNFFYLHYNDAWKLTEAAEIEKTKLRSMYARHAILAVVFAGEALINKLLDDYSQLPSRGKYLERLGVREKWIVGPALSGKHGAEGRTFDPGAEPFQSFSELVGIRNWLAHPKGGRFMEAAVDGSTITLLPEEVDVPWVDTIQGPVWPQTKIPKNPFELTAEHARVALEVLRKLVEELKRLQPETVTKAWLEKVVLRDKETGEKQELTIDSLFGGYTPDGNHEQ